MRLSTNHFDAFRFMMIGRGFASISQVECRTDQCPFHVEVDWARTVTQSFNRQSHAFIAVLCTTEHEGFYKHCGMKEENDYCAHRELFLIMKFKPYGELLKTLPDEYWRNSSWDDRENPKFGGYDGKLEHNLNCNGGWKSCSQDSDGGKVIHFKLYNFRHPENTNEEIANAIQAIFKANEPYLSRKRFEELDEDDFYETYCWRVNGHNYLNPAPSRGPFLNQFDFDYTKSFCKRLTV